MVPAGSWEARYSADVRSLGFISVVPWAFRTQRWGSWRGSSSPPTFLLLTNNGADVDLFSISGNLPYFESAMESPVDADIIEWTNYFSTIHWLPSDFDDLCGKCVECICDLPANNRSTTAGKPVGSISGAGKKPLGLAPREGPLQAAYSYGSFIQQGNCFPSALGLQDMLCQSFLNKCVRVWEQFWNSRSNRFMCPPFGDWELWRCLLFDLTHLISLQPNSDISMLEFFGASVSSSSYRNVNDHKQNYIILLEAKNLLTGREVFSLRRDQ